jgi:hypothetical protein
MVLLVGLLVTGAVLLAQWRLVATRPEHFRTERLRGAITLAVLFVSFAVLHRYLSEAEQPKQPCCLTLFGEESRRRRDRTSGRAAPGSAAAAIDIDVIVSSCSGRVQLPTFSARASNSRGSPSSRHP